MNIEEIRNEIDDTIEELEDNNNSDLSVDEIIKTNTQAKKKFIEDRNNLNKNASESDDPWDKEDAADYEKVDEEDFDTVNAKLCLLAVDEKGKVLVNEKNLEILKEAKDLTDNNYAILEG